MKSLRILTCVAVAVFMMAGTVLAMPTDWTDAQKWTIQDKYIGGSLDKVNDIYEHNGGDVISGAGSENLFDIDWMDIYYLDNYLKVDIHTDYVGGTLGTNYGDLFISSDGWNPFGDSPYLQDTMANGEKWEYAFDVSSGNLYDITNAQGSILKSDDVMTSGQYRNGQEVLINNAGLTSIGTGGTAGRVGEYYSMVMDVSGIQLDFAGLKDGVGFHWAMTCGNDTIEGRIPPTPEPGTMLLLGSGLLGLLGYRRRFKK
ncbi:MAG: hypothetical protein BWK80_57010 [Desulfobacteraceae bacterium IS3]|nr:MAG: hypothetical protein BWK80_57010 [Desulfobacteraceae bacterium IS3]